MSKHTLQIFRHLGNNLPPLFPDELAQNLRLSLESFENRDDFLLEDLEKEMIKHGFNVWPFYKAHKDFLDKAIEEMGDHFLEPQLSDSTKDKYTDFKNYGGDWHDIYSGRAAEYFEPEERVDIGRALVETKNKLKDYVKQDIHGLSKDRYLERVNKYHFILAEIKNELDVLRDLAAKEDHEALAEQIQAKIEDIEHSFAHLGKELQYHEIFNAVEFFRGRKNKLARLRGIDIPKKIDLYN